MPAKHMSVNRLKSISLKQMVANEASAQNMRLRNEGAHLTLDQAECLCNGEVVPEADSDDARELLNYLSAIEFVSEHTSENVDNLQCHRIDAFSYLSSLI
ncbi:MAG: hypothetical protein LJE94_04640 [Deltaproteobacteria bacterium]|nr:hypothetical protein [Deltaproteobacteria bacterium]